MISFIGVSDKNKIPKCFFLVHQQTFHTASVSYLTFQIKKKRKFYSWKTHLKKKLKNKNGKSQTGKGGNGKEMHNLHITSSHNKPL